jgi:mannan endo-1,4-beta-mannosidase
MRYSPARDEEDAPLTPEPGSGHRKNGSARRGSRRPAGKRRRMLTVGAAIVAVLAIVAGVTLYNKASDQHSTSAAPLPVHLPAIPESYLGVYTNTAPSSYRGVTAFTSATGTKPDVVMYYSGWYVPFPSGFATTVADHGAAPLVQMNPSGISLAKIAAGQYDGYLSEYAEAVRAYGHPVIMSFGHEMNGNWYSWGYTKTSPATFVAAWRHIVTLFRALDAKNVTWLWTVNVINNTQTGTIPSPAQWWPGSSYVNWVGIDGYYLKANWQFAPLFGPTIASVRTLTQDPILIGETGATQAAGQPAKLADVFAGVHLYGLLGFVYFDATNYQGQNFSLSSPAALEAFGKGASAFTRPTS